uniref:5-hydroxytryptamine receptor 3A n=2 Tax=Petromyzon marinus TaxID=7757 RepID=A0AAJ7X3J8_PETMA|nr:5-hydroxytryptamine receptor 3A [Petromyzon marinus]
MEDRETVTKGGSGGALLLQHEVFHLKLHLFLLLKERAAQRALRNLARNPSCFAAHSTNAHKKTPLRNLSSRLSSGYDKGVRPVKNWRQPIIVAIDVMLYAILNVDEKNQVLTAYIWYRQRWTDEFLQWDPVQYDGIEQISIPTNNIWVPDIMISEFVDVGKSPDIGYVYLSYNGTVMNYKPLQVVSACSLDIYSFPFDVQNCTLTFTSWLHTSNDINLTLWRTTEEIKEDKSIFLNFGEWELISVPNELLHPLYGENRFSELKIYVVIRRRPLFYVVNLIMPSAFLMVMDIAGFYLPPDSGERVSFKITLLLGYSVFLIVVQDTLPATPIGTPLIAVYFVVCMALLVISLMETIFIVRLVHKQDVQSHVPPWLKKWLLSRGSVILCRKQIPYPRSVTFPNDGAQNAADNENPSPFFRCEEKVCEHGGEGQMPTSTIRRVLREISGLRRHLEKQEEEKQVTGEWLQVGHVLDSLLFRLYLLVIVMYTLTLGILWSIWSYSETL